MKVVTVKQMQTIDRKAIQEKGIPGEFLMENAGRVAAEKIDRSFNVLGRNIAIVAGKGNNGGDGFVVARHLREQAGEIGLFLVGKVDEVKGDALVNLKRALEGGLRVREVLDDGDLGEFGEFLDSADIVVDSLFGTGLKGAVRGLPARVINRMNSSMLPVVAVDTPSGMDSDTGTIPGPCIGARLTVTMGLPKLGQLFYPGKEKVGELHVAEIGFPRDLLESVETPYHMDSAADIAGMLPDRRPDAHKGDCGRVFIISGSPGLTGAACLAGNAAMRMGAGLVTVGTPRSLNPVLEVKLTEVMTLPLEETESGTLSPAAIEAILERVEGASAVALGPGISTHHETGTLVRKLLGQIDRPLVVDADGLNNIAGRLDLLRGRQAVITPHPGEMSRLIGKSISRITANRLEIAGETAAEYGIYVVLKGAPTVIACPDGPVYINTTGNAGMASGGTGDVLTGLIVSLLGQGLGPGEASRVGVYLHGLSGDIALKKKGVYGLVAGDLIDRLPKAVRRTIAESRITGCQWEQV